MAAKPLYQILANSLQAMRNCQETNNIEWRDRHEDTIIKLVERYLPSGSGFDNGTKFDFDRSNPNRLVFTTSFHHMNENGYYDGWTEHTVIITPSLVSGFESRITGRDRNEIKDYIGETFHHALGQDVEPI
jgi:hypothetical protein